MRKPLITFTSDFGVQSRGLGSMEAVAYEICPDAHVVHLQHGLPDYDIVSGALALESIRRLQPGGIHVCVVDPGVGTARRPIAIETMRGDIFIGPDNGVLRPAVRLLGGSRYIVHITERKYMREPVSPVFHGRDIFTPAAAHIAAGVPMSNLGELLAENDLVEAPYEDAKPMKGRIEASVITINKYGSLALNILHEDFDTLVGKAGKSVVCRIGEKSIRAAVCETFGDVAKGEVVILRDDYARIEVAINLGNFAAKFGVRVGDSCIVSVGSVG